jgi:hypothetical protein
VSAADVERAREMADESMEFRRLAHEHAAEGHVRAARAHRAAAAVAELAGRHERAEVHLAAALADEVAAAEDRRLEAELRAAVDGHGQLSS